ncbi:putative cyclin-dependent kinase 2 [Xylogone sp. PMI_703]|nr:putative cyclin-dependent kinase 2 [Xylogone sp. PMI_703]
MDKLVEELRNAKKEWPPNGNKYFIPIDVLDRLVSKSEIESVLKARPPPPSHPGSISDYADKIYHLAKKIFAILLMMSKERNIYSLIEEGITDDDLPFTRVYLEDNRSPQEQDRRFYLGKKSHSSCQNANHDNCRIRAMVDWKEHDVRVFCGDQWIVQAPVFEGPNGTVQHYPLDENTILPFISDNEKELDTNGGYSHVWKVMIHAAHQRFSLPIDNQGTLPFLAVKRLLSREETTFRAETDMLKAMANRKHEHIVKLLATYKYKGSYHLVFPLADGNLRDYWNKAEMPAHDSKTYLWFICQISGMASALNAIHNFRTEEIPGLEYSGSDSQECTVQSSTAQRITIQKEEARFGRHGDIKPENILYFSKKERGVESESTLQIADFGLSRFHRMESRSKITPRGMARSPTYMPPELALEKLISRAYDMWSLGCVLLEFITWLLKGGKAIYEFAEKRDEKAPDGVNDDTFYTVQELENKTKEAVVRKGVVDWISSLYENGRCSPMIRALLRLVESKMLVIDPSQRLKADELDPRLSDICDEAKRDVSYLIGPV